MLLLLLHFPKSSVDYEEEFNEEEDEQEDDD